MKTHSILLMASFTALSAFGQQMVLQPSVPRNNRIFQMGTDKTPDGHFWQVDSKGMLFDGKPVLPVMGEIHYSRCEAKEWRNEVRKMKAGGVTLLATYVFWNHHEMNHGRFDWKGNRSLHKFLEVCRSEQMPVVLRIGPFCHGEVRNGGFPDWLVDSKCRLRSLDPSFMSSVESWWKQVYRQCQGELWKDGGPIVGVQIENECRGPWDYLQSLKTMAVNIGFDVPFYTRTGWPKLNGTATFGELLPLYGDYADGFWDRKLTDMPGEYPQAFDFKASRLSTVIATEALGKQNDKMDAGDLSYPYLTCELGGGMMPSYHRRIHIFPLDALAVAVCKVGSGSNLPGYYMYHGGTNPTASVFLNETQATPVTNYNDMPHFTYDFQAPLGEVGQPHESYFWLRRFHLFLSSFGGELNGWDTTFPQHDSEKTDTPLRWTVRTDGMQGYVFFNNYQRMASLPAISDVQFHLQRTDGTTLEFPKTPFTMPADACGCFPFGLKWHGLTVNYATAQPMWKMEGRVPTLVLAAVGHLPVEISVGEGKDEKLFQLGDVKQPKLLHLTAPGGSALQILVLDEAHSLKAYPVEKDGEPFLVFADGVATQQATNVVAVEQLVCQTQQNTAQLEVEVFPQTGFVGKNCKVLHEGMRHDGFAFCTLQMKMPSSPTWHWKQTREAGAPRKVALGRNKVAVQPNDSDYVQAAEWQMESKGSFRADQLFRVDYTADAARVCVNGKEVQDNFYNGEPMWVRANLLKGKTCLQILPYPADAPIYWQKAERSKLNATNGSMPQPKVSLYQRLSFEWKLQ